MITVRSDAPLSVAQLLPAASISGVMPSSASLPLNHCRASRHTGPHASRCAPSAFDVSFASSRRFETTSCALIARQYISSTDFTDFTDGSCSYTRATRLEEPAAPGFARRWQCVDRRDRKSDVACLFRISRFIALPGREGPAAGSSRIRVIRVICGPCLYARARSSSPELLEGSATRSRCAPPPTAPTSSSPRRPPSRIRSCRARFTRRPPMSKRPAARRSRSRPTSATKRRSMRRSPRRSSASAASTSSSTTPPRSASPARSTRR